MTARFAVRCAIVFPDNAGRHFRRALKSAQSREISDARTSGDFPFHRESVRTRPVPGLRPTGESCAAHDENYQPTAHRASPKPRLRMRDITSLRWAYVRNRLNSFGITAASSSPEEAYKSQVRSNCSKTSERRRAEPPPLPPARRF